MATLVLSDGTVADTEGAYIVDVEITAFEDPNDAIDYADQHGVPLNNLLHDLGYTV